MHTLLLLEHLQCRRQFGFGLRLRPLAGQQPAQFLVANRLVEIVLDVPARTMLRRRLASAVRSAPMGIWN